MHKENCIHFDIKHENILVHFPGQKFDSPKELKDTYKSWEFGGQKEVKFLLCDFGLSIRLNKDKKSLKKNLIGTSGLIPPENVKSRYNQSTKAHDVYSFGATMYRCLTFEIPFEVKHKLNFEEGY